MSARKATCRPKAKTVATLRREAVERAFSDVICKRVAFTCASAPAGDERWSDWVDGEQYTLKFTVEASAQTLVSHGFVKQKALDRYGLKQTNRGTVQACVYYYEDGDTSARDLARKIGISDPQYLAWTGDQWRKVEGKPRKVESRGNVIQFPKTPAQVLSVLSGDVRPSLLSVLAQMEARSRGDVLAFALGRLSRQREDAMSHRDE